MKLKHIIPLVALLIMFSCSKEENEIVEDNSVKIANLEHSSVRVCETEDGYIFVDIYYDSRVLVKEDIPLIREAYFRDFPLICFSRNQPDDTFHDIWGIPLVYPEGDGGSPGGVIEEDPRVNFNPTGD